MRRPLPTASARRSKWQQKSSTPEMNNVKAHYFKVRGSNPRMMFSLTSNNGRPNKNSMRLETLKSLAVCVLCWYPLHRTHSGHRHAHAFCPEVFHLRIPDKDIPAMTPLRSAESLPRPGSGTPADITGGPEGDRDHQGHQGFQPRRQQPLPSPRFSCIDVTQKVWPVLGKVRVKSLDAGVPVENYCLILCSLQALFKPPKFRAQHSRVREGMRRKRGVTLCV